MSNGNDTNVYDWCKPNRIMHTFDSSFHAEVEGGQIAGFFPFRVEDGHQPLQPTLRLALTVCRHRIGEFVGIVRRYERFHLPHRKKKEKKTERMNRFFLVLS